MSAGNIIHQIGTELRNRLERVRETVAGKDVEQYRCNNVLAGAVVGTGPPHGANSHGDWPTVDLSHYGNNSTSAARMHFKLPFKVSGPDVDWYIRLYGYQYGARQVMDLTWAGAIKDGELVGVAHRHAHGTLDTYINDNGDVTLMARLGLIYFTTGTMESMSSRPETLIRRGQVKMTFAVDDRITF